MSLLQISEPKQNHDEPSKRFAVGIDLGTTNSLIASALEEKVKVYTDDEGNALLPSVAAYKQDGSIQIGEKARKMAADDPYNTIASVKRLMGRSVKDLVKLSGQLPYQLTDSQENMPKIITCQGLLSPVQVSADILTALKQRAEKKENRVIEGAVVTVPAYFDDAQRQATKDAVKLAGLPLLRLLSEPTAAAIAYGLDAGAKGIHVIYDLGGGTFDLSILKLNKGVFEVMGTGGDSALGGDDIDHLIANWILSSYSFSAMTAEQHRELLMLSRALKERLTTELKVEVFFQGWHGVLTREEFNQLILPLVDKTLSLAEQVLREAGLSFSQIDAVVLVGGVTRIPFIREKIEKLFGQSPLSNIDPDRVVAIGAAIQANILIGNHSNENLLLLDVLPLSLGLETMGGLTEKIIERNTPIPVSRSQQFTTYQDDQIGMVIHVVQGERELVKDCRSLAKFELTGIPPMKAGAARIEVLFQVDADGLLSVSAKELSTQKVSHIEVKPSYGLTDKEISEMLNAAYAHAEEDAQMKELMQKKVDANQLIDMLSIALKEDGKQFLSDTEYALLGEKIKALKKTTEGQDRHAISAAIEELDKASEVFAHKRMEATLKKALIGKNIKEIDHAKD